MAKWHREWPQGKNQIASIVLIPLIKRVEGLLMFILFIYQQQYREKNMEYDDKFSVFIDVISFCTSKSRANFTYSLSNCLVQLMAGPRKAIIL